ncbi:MAG: cupin domain-containing protein, partial [Chloroflexi bacterium]
QLEGQITLANGHPAGYPTKPLAVLHCQNGKWLITAWQNTPVMTHTFADPPPPKQTPTLLQPGEGETLLEVIGQRVVTAKVKSVETGGRWSLVEYVAPPHFTGPPPHFHREMSESFYVLSGELSVAVENEVSTHSAGSFVNVPAGMTHTFANQLDHPTTFLIWMSPGGFEQYFADLHQLIATEGGQWPLSDMRKVAVIEQKYDINYPQQSS